jgi:hypothetical protein
VKLQQAYISESDSVGTWALIGYKGPGEGDATSSATNNFEYSDGISAKAAIPSDATVGWTAHNKVKLNDCGADDNWTVSVASAGTDGASGDATFTAAVKDNNADCVALTPSFSTIGK